MTRFVVVIPAGGEPLAVPLGEDRLATLQNAVGGRIDYLPEAFHELDGFEVVHLDDWHGRAENHAASRLIGLPASCEPLRGPVVLVPLPQGQDNRAEREHQRRFFGMLDAVGCGFCTADEAGIGTLIRVAEA